MRISVSSLIVSFISILATVHSTAAQERFPVWWSPEFGVDSRADIERRLSEPLPAELRITLGRHSYELNPNEQGPVATCNDYIRFRADGFVAKSADDHAAAYALRRRCYPLSALLRAEPARTSEVRSFKMTDDAFDYLPPLLAGFCNFVPRFLEANRNGVPWSQFDFKNPHPLETNAFARDDNTFVEQILSDNEVLGEEIFSIVGRGDFDGDGQDDLLIRKQFFLNSVFPDEPPRLEIFDLFVLTRGARDTVLRVTDVVAPLGSAARICSIDPKSLQR